MVPIPRSTLFVLAVGDKSLTSPSYPCLGHLAPLRSKVLPYLSIGNNSHFGYVDWLSARATFSASPRPHRHTHGFTPFAWEPRIPNPRAYGKSLGVRQITSTFSVSSNSGTTGGQCTNWLPLSASATLVTTSRWARGPVCVRRHLWSRGYYEPACTFRQRRNLYLISPNPSECGPTGFPASQARRRRDRALRQ